MISFSKDECERIINLSNVLKKTERDEYPRKISYDFYSVGYSLDHKWIFDRMDEFFTQSTGIFVTKPLDAVHLFNYSVGDQFMKHRDVYYDGQVWNIGVCLNDDYEGGDFILYEPSEILPKKQGEIYTFECKREHEVLMVTKGNRWSLIGFYFYDNLNIKRPLI